MLHPDGIEVFLRPVGSHGEDAKYDELVLPPKADYEGRYLQCFIPHRDEGFEIVVEYFDLLDMHGASTMLVGVVLKPADAMDDVPSYSLGHVAEHAKNMPSDENVLATQGGFQMQWLVGNGVTNGEDHRHVCNRMAQADMESSSRSAQIRAQGRRVRGRRSSGMHWYLVPTWKCSVGRRQV